MPPSRATVAAIVADAPTIPPYFGVADDVTGAAGTASIDVTPPANVTAGSSLLLAVFIASLTDTVATPAGWTLSAGPIQCTTGGNLTAYLFTKVAAGGDSAVTVTKTGTNGSYRGLMYAAEGCTVEDVTTYAASAVNTSHTVGSVTTQDTNYAAVILCGTRGASNTHSFATYTERADRNSGQPNAAVADQPHPKAGATGSEVVTTTVSATLAAFHVALKPT